MPMFVQNGIVDVEAETSWDVFVQHAEDPSIAYRWTWVIDGNVRAFDRTYEGTARPAWYPAAEPDNYENFSAPSQSNGHYYFSMTAAGGRRVDWNVPAAGAGIDTIRVYFIGLASNAGELEAVKNPGASEVVLGTIDTNIGDSEYGSIEDITGFDPLVEGDVVAFRCKSGDSDPVRLESWFGWDSDGTVSDYDTQYYIPTEEAIDVSGSSIEVAYQVAPTGESLKWCGGGHQGGSDCTEVTPTLAYVVDGSDWTPATGWISGDIQLSRSSSVQYDDTPTVIGTMAYVYQIAKTQITVFHTFTASAALDVGSLYPVMADVGVMANAIFVSGGYASIGDLTGTTGYAKPGTSLKGATRYIYVGGTPLGAYWETTALKLDMALNDVFCKIEETKKKAYFKYDISSIANGDVISSAVRWKFTNRIGPPRGVRNLVTL